ncbi:MAG TPA: energy transducer TonB, partial [Byssovorax sp.]
PPPPPPVVAPLPPFTASPSATVPTMRAALGAPPFARFLNAMHNELHPLFADGVIAQLDRDKRFTDDSMFVRILIALDPADGRVVRRDVERSSGAAEFDALALAAIDKAAPFGAAPREIVSDDGRVHVAWEFHRSHLDACSTRNAWPIMVRASRPQATPSGAP